MLVPNLPFAAVGNELVSLTLVAFDMQQQWYNINDTNNTFYAVSNDVYVEVQIPAGMYTSFDDATDGLREAVETAVSVPPWRLMRARSSSTFP